MRAPVYLPGGTTPIAEIELPERAAPDAAWDRGYPEFVAQKDVARRLSVSTQTVARWREQGRLPGHEIDNGSWRYRVADVDAFLESTRRGGNVVEIPRRARR